MAADVSARVHLVAEKLQQKAQDAQRKGNDGAARALAASVSDLRAAMALLAEQRHLLARRRGEGDDAEDDADAHVQELAARLARVEAMLGKKSEDMKAKGNEGAAAALQQSAGAVDKGRALLLEQQQQLFGLRGRWEKLEGVVEAQQRRRASDAEQQQEEKEADTPHGRLIARVRRLVLLDAVLAEAFPECREAGQVMEEVERLRNDVKAARDETLEVNEMLKQESLALEEAKKEMERMRYREELRQEEDAALLDQQREACQAMEELVRESDQEIQKLTQSAAARAEELQSLRVEMESLASEKERLVRAHADEINELQAQLASAMDALSTQADASEEVDAEELRALQTKLDELTLEKEDLIKLHADEIEELRRQLESVSASLDVKSEDNAAFDANELEALQTQINDVTSEKEDLAKAHADEIEELRQAHISEIEELRQQLESVTASDELESLQTQVDKLASEKEDLVKSHADEVEELQRSYAVKIEELESAAASFSAKSKDNAASDADELKSLQTQVNNLILEKEDLVKTHAGEVEELEKSHAIKIDELRRQLENAAVSLADKVEGNATFDANELESLQTQVDNLVSEQENLIQSHADEVEELRQAHANEILELRQQLEGATACLAAKEDDNAAFDADELESLQTHVNGLTSEKEDLIKSHADEIEELQKSHTIEIEAIRQQLDDAINSLAAKTEDMASLDAEEVQSLQAKVNCLMMEKEDIMQTHADETEDLRRQLESVTTSLAQTGNSAAINAEEIQSLKDEISTLIAEKTNLAESHASELEELQASHLDEIEDLRHQLDNITAAISAKSDEQVLSNSDELQQLRAEVGALTIEKDHLVKEHAGEIEKLKQQVEGTVSDGESVSEEKELNEEDDGGNEAVGDVPVLELEEDDSQLTAFAAEDEVEASPSAGDVASDSKKVDELNVVIDSLQAQLAKYDERSQAQQDTISTLERGQEGLLEQVELLTNDKTQAVETLDELQRAHEAEVLTMQTNLDTLEARVTEYEECYQKQQDTISTLDKERTELQGRIEVLIDEKEEAVNALLNTHGEETERLTQSVADNEDVIESLSSQLAEMRSALAAKLAEHSETADALQQCEAELRTCRSELDAQVRECTQVKNDLEAIQDAENAKSEEIDAEAVRVFAEKLWESPEVTELCSRLVSLLSELVSVQDQLRMTEEQKDSIRKECDGQKLFLDQFVKNADWRLFAKDGEDEEEVVESLKSVNDVTEQLTVAKTNITRWLDELQQLQDRVQLDTIKLHDLEQEKLREQERLVTLEASKNDLDSLVESLNVELAAVRSEKADVMKTAEKLKAQNDSASVQEQQQQAAQQEEVAELQQQLATVRSDFERYRVRSHTALKKMEKRAELLNGMRKENEALLKQVQESDQQREQADVARQESEGRLQEVLRTQEMMQADFDQFAAEKARVIAELEEEGQRLLSEREQTDKQIQDLTLKIQELEKEKAQIEEESERIKQAEQKAFQARLSTATAAVQTAKQDLQKMHDALEASKAENDKRQKRIEALELELKQQQASVQSTAVTTSPAIPSPTAYASPLTSPSAEAKGNVAGLEKELSTLRASEVSLRKQLDDARAELIALQERFATTKAANAEKVFALEEQSNHWKIALAAATEEARRLNVMIETQKSTIGQSTSSNGTSVASPVNQQSQEKHTHTTQIPERSEEVLELKTELADANTEIKLLTRALDACREELQSARDHIDLLASTSSEPESGEDPSGASKASAVLVAKDEALKKLRMQVLELQEELQTLREEKGALELELEKEELDELQASRKNLQSEKERAMQLQRRQTLVSGFEKQVTTLVNELQQRLEDHSSAFREVCDFRDEHRAALFANGDGVNGDTNSARRAGEPEFEECLVMRSGVVIKAGASFQLPVICEKRGWRVVWNFSVKEDSADVSFKLAAMMADATSTEVEVVSPERMNDMSGVFQVQHDNTTLLFEWDNSFSWLNEKTLDYHVSIQEPLTPQAQKVRQSERGLQTKAKLLEDGLALIQVEAQRRSELSATLERLCECESAKNKHLAEFEARKTEVLAQKSRFQEEMDAQKSAFSAMLREQDELEDVERSITRAWEAAVAEREDVEMTLQLAGNGAQLETLAQEMTEQVESVAEQLKNPPRPEETSEQQADEHGSELVDGHAEGEASAQKGDADANAYNAAPVASGKQD
ncbi:Myosin-like protein [Phytophthora cinnamomi]|uniref:Myosin-like protein n=1 Tax=Phytophthora cinnamomi TaxID=4785 RepID=UPI003559D3AC|nr:Myosin-like protein [Phytophthora cinnamomi]